MAAVYFLAVHNVTDPDQLLTPCHVLAVRLQRVQGVLRRGRDGAAAREQDRCPEWGRHQRRGSEQHPQHRPRPRRDLIAQPHSIDPEIGLRRVGFGVFLDDA